MQCPKCKANMEKISTAAGDVERCTACQGLWLDVMVHSDIRKIAKEVDTGDAAEGAKLNTTDHINCPSCPSSQLIRMVDPIQPHIWFESCPTCYGRFFDAGELTDLSERTLSDFIKKFSVEERL
ncbi:MAG TPA: zf-TFIIB domain-containing protein [Arenimonas sp.]|nr:zf-TFIIB domain-containing protein [Arenimonas sp.]HOZ05948.1 zf-TFIIB domain-containing protein [Arenimonas sp.]HPO25061.1 zf-TFIIB domain-containing protein [Arenimonas sp.]HPW33730.1 zf-TFIIB domain-containing protein [Arenimonas sp.]